MSRGLRRFACCLLAASASFALADGTAPSPGSATGAAAASPASGTQATKTPQWVIGIARLSIDGSAGTLAALQSTLPLLIVASLGELPPHYISPENASETAALTTERTRFGLGSDLAARLDDRALRFLDPALRGGERHRAMGSADTTVSAARSKFETALAPLHAAPSAPAPTTLPATLWEGNRGGELLDASTSLPSSIAQAKGVDLLLYGSIRDRSGYAEVNLTGYDAALGRDVFSWTGYCSPDDPAPLALSLAHKIEEWTAGREFARVDISPVPDSALISVDGIDLPQGSRTLYRFHPGTIQLRFDAPGYTPAVSSLDVSLGDRKSVTVRLDPAHTGSVTVTTSPPDASISLDSLPKGTGPLVADLNGSRIVATVSAPGYETATTVLPRSGTADIDIKLLPADPLGPGGRVERSKDGFYKSLGWLVLSIPVTALAAGIENGYAEGAIRTGDPQLFSEAQNAQVALGAAAVATGVFAINAIIHLVIYLRSAR